LERGDKRIKRLTGLERVTSFNKISHCFLYFSLIVIRELRIQSRVSQAGPAMPCILFVFHEKFPVHIEKFKLLLYCCEGIYMIRSALDCEGIYMIRSALDCQEICMIRSALGRNMHDALSSEVMRSNHGMYMFFFYEVQVEIMLNLLNIHDSLSSGKKYA
jgi:hypothetical protein